MLALLAGGMLVVVSAEVAAAAVTTRHVPVSGPVFAGGHVAWTDALRNGGFAVRIAPAAGGPRRLLGTFAPSRRRYLLEPKVAASASRVGVELREHFLAGKYESPATALQSFASSPEGPLVALTRRCGLADAYPLRSLDVAADVVAYREASCESYGSSAARTADFSSGAAAPGALPSHGDGLRTAGAFAAWFERPEDELVVYDRARGAELYRVPTLRLPGGRGSLRFTSVALSREGKVAFTLPGRGARRTIALASPARPQGRIVKLPVARHYAVRFAGERLLVMRSPTSSNGAIVDGTLELRELSGRLMRVIARGVDDQVLNERFDTDGASVVYVTRGCRGATMRVQRLDSPTATFRAPRRCGLRFTRPPRLSGGHLRFTPDCRGMLGACAFGYAVVTARSGGRRGAIVTIARDDGGGGFPPGSGEAELRLTRAGRRLIARQRAIRARVTLHVGDPSYYDRSEISAVQRRAATVTLRAR